MDPSQTVTNAKDAVGDAARKTVEKATEALTPEVPGVPSSEPAPFEEPTEPQGFPPHRDQGSPDRRTPTGAETDLAATAVGQGLMAQHRAWERLPAVVG